MKFLSLSFCKSISDLCFDHFTQLESLNLEYTDKGIRLLRHKSLRHLFLGFCFNLTDACLDHIATLSNLETLGLDNTNIISIAALTSLPKLNYLRLNNCDRLNDVEVILLMRSLKVVDIFECGLIKEENILLTYRGEIQMDKYKVTICRIQEYSKYLEALI
jgi:Leucine-rich repeat (LRR) protein